MTATLPSAMQSRLEELASLDPRVGTKIISEALGLYVRLNPKRPDKAGSGIKPVTSEPGN